VAGLDGGCDTLSNFILVAVAVCGVDMSVTDRDGVFDGFLNFSWC
jgi:hypothetical protein